MTTPKVMIPRLSELRTDLVVLWILTTGSLCLGMLLNQLRDVPVPLVYRSKEERIKDAVTRVVPSGELSASARPLDGAGGGLPEYVDLNDVVQSITDKRGVILDARPEIFHRLGHIPGALSLPRDDFENGYATLRSKLEADKDQLIIIYCSGVSCEDSRLVRKALLELGFTGVSIFKEGWAMWTKAGQDEERNL